MPILILGMHRSGTSAITRLINLMGAYVGPKHLLLGENADNPKGFWERKDVIRVNSMLLNRAGCTWFKVDNFVPPAIDAQTAALMQSVMDDLEAHPPWATKDPRLCITLPCWSNYIFDPLCIIVSRDPLEIAHSLELRNNIPQDYALALWEFYAVGIIRNSIHYPRIFVSHEALLRSPMQTTRMLHTTLSAKKFGGLHCPTETEVSEFIDPTLHRAHKPGNMRLSAHQQMLDAMLRGDMDFDASVEASPQARKILETLGYELNTSPVDRQA